MSGITNLEARFIDQVCIKTDLKTVFADFLNPNEYFPEGIKPHLEPGLWVTTGTERSFFLLSLDEENQCDCMVVRDVNPKVKAYNDFNILLLRLSETREEYEKLSKRPEYMDKDEGETLLLQDRIPLIRQKLLDAKLDEKLKAYYLENLDSFATIYFNELQDWRTIEKQFFSKCRYDLVDDLFHRVQKKAKEGKIISTLGCINDLTLLGDRKVAIIDTSNISDYIFINPQLSSACSPRIIHTTDIPFTKFYSHRFVPLTSVQRARFETLLEWIGKGADKIIKRMRMGVALDPTDDHAWPVYSSQALAILERATTS